MTEVPGKGRVLRRAPLGGDIISSLTAPPAADAAASTPAPAGREPATPPAPAPVAPRTVRRARQSGPEAQPAPSSFRPRDRVTRVPFSSQLEIGLRQRVEAHNRETGEKVVDLLDRALRMALGEQQ